MNLRYFGIVSLFCVALVACSDGPKPKPPTPAVPAPVKPAPAPSTSGGASTEAAPSTPKSEAPSPHSGAAASSDMKKSGQNDDPTIVQVAGLTAPKPVTWTWQTVEGKQFRDLNYIVPGEGASTAAAELIVSIFNGAGGGGPIDSNINRWVGQFKAGESGAITPIKSEKTIDGMKVTLVEIKGSYVGMTLPNAVPSDAKPAYVQLTAIVDAPGRRVFFKLIGPEATVERERANWNTLVDGIRLTK